MKAQTVSVRKPVHLPLPMDKTALSIAILLILIFSKYIYMASLTSYYTFYMIHKFNVSVQDSQLYLFIFLVATAIGTLIGGPVGDRIGRKYVIWASILGAAPFSLLMPHANLLWTIILLCGIDAFFRFSCHIALCTGVASYQTWIDIRFVLWICFRSGWCSICCTWQFSG